MSVKAINALTKKIDEVRTKVDTIVAELSEVGDDIRVWAEAKLQEISANLAELSTKIGESEDEGEDK